MTITVLKCTGFLMALLSVLVVPPDEAGAVRGGYQQIPSAGIVKIQGESNCTGTIISTSAAGNYTWVLTAAHCFWEKEPSIFWFNIRPQQVPPAQPVAGSLLVTNASPSLTGGTVVLHPSWDLPSTPFAPFGNDPDWFEDPDLALIRFNQHIPVDAAAGDYRRPIYVGSSRCLDDLDEGRFGIRTTVTYCGYNGSRELECLDAGNLEQEEDGRFLVVDGGEWRDTSLGRGTPVFEFGDSGGPLLVGSTRLGGGPGGLARDGIVAGVVQAPRLGGVPNEFDHYFAATTGQRGWFEEVEASFGEDFLLVTGNGERRAPAPANIRYREEDSTFLWQGNPAHEYQVSASTRLRECEPHDERLLGETWYPLATGTERVLDFTGRRYVSVRARIGGSWTEWSGSIIVNRPAPAPDFVPGPGEQIR